MFVALASAVPSTVGDDVDFCVTSWVPLACEISTGVLDALKAALLHS